MTESKEYYYNLIKKNGKRIVDVPDEYRTLELYMLAIKNKLLLKMFLNNIKH